MITNGDYWIVKLNAKIINILVIVWYLQLQLQKMHFLKFGSLFCIFPQFFLNFKKLSKRLTIPASRGLRSWSRFLDIKFFPRKSGKFPVQSIRNQPLPVPSISCPFKTGHFPSCLSTKNATGILEFEILSDFSSFSRPFKNFPSGSE